MFFYLFIKLQLKQIHANHLHVVPTVNVEKLMAIQCVLVLMDILEHHHLVIRNVLLILIVVKIGHVQIKNAATPVQGLVERMLNATL